MKPSLDEDLKEYQKQLNNGTLQKAYQSLMNYIATLRNYLISKYANDLSFGQLYQGYLDFSYFTLTPHSLKNHQLKIVLLYEHKTSQFEIMLVGQNKRIQQHYWQQLKQTDYTQYPLLADATEAIIRQLLIAKPQFNNPSILTQDIENSVLDFVREISKAIEALPD